MKIRHEGIERETEKAILVTIEVDTAIGFKGMKAWYPKSQISYNEDMIDCPNWLISAKCEEYTNGKSWAEPVDIIEEEKAVAKSAPIMEEKPVSVKIENIQSKVMKLAHKLYKTVGIEEKTRVTWSECLKISWKELREQPIIPEYVTCDCGHTVTKQLVMNASSGTCCSDCYDDMSD